MDAHLLLLCGRRNGDDWEGQRTFPTGQTLSHIISPCHTRVQWLVHGEALLGYMDSAAQKFWSPEHMAW